MRISGSLAGLALLATACASSPQHDDDPLPEGTLVRTADLRFLEAEGKRQPCKADGDCPAGALCHPGMRACFEPYPSIRVLDVDVKDEMTVEKDGKICELVPIYFGPDSAALVEEARRWLVHNTRCLRGARSKRIRLVGYADARGDDGHNLKLSRLRTQVVRDFLKDRGIASPIVAVGKGEDDPLFTGTSERDYAYNRRVELRVEDR